MIWYICDYIDITLYSWLIKFKVVNEYEWMEVIGWCYELRREKGENQTEYD